MAVDQAARMREYRAKYPDKVKAASARYRAKKATWMREKRSARRQQIAELKSRPCMDCGGTFPACAMDYDHRNPTEKSFDISMTMTRSWDVILAEIQKCDVVCANCHRIRTFLRKEAVVV